MSAVEPPPSRLIASLGAESDDQLGEFGEGQAGVDAGAAAVADERGQLLVGDRERGAWVAAGGDVGVELVGASDEALRVVEEAEWRPVADEQRAGLQQVAGGPGRQVRAGRDPDLAVLDVDRGPRGLVRVGDGFGLDLAAVDPELAQRRAVWAEEEAADDRFPDAGEPAPAVERLRDGEVFDAQPRLAPWVADDVDGRLLAVGELVAEKLVTGGKRPHRHPSSEASSLRG